MGRGIDMQNNISCFEVLIELYEENKALQNELRIIVHDIEILKQYIYYWKSYKLLRDIREAFIPRNFSSSNKRGFVEDYCGEGKKPDWKVFSVKGTTKFVISLLFQKIKVESETITDMLEGTVDDFFEDKQSELSELYLTQQDQGLIRSCLAFANEYKAIKGKNTRYSIFELSSEQLDDMKSFLLKFLMYSQDEIDFDIDYSTLEQYLNKTNFLNILEELTVSLIDSKNSSEEQTNIWQIMLFLAKLRIAVTDSGPLQPREITKDKGRNNFLEFSTKMTLNELKFETEKLQKELELLFAPLLDSRFIRSSLYEFFFECRGNLTK